LRSERCSDAFLRQKYPISRFIGRYCGVTAIFRRTHLQAISSSHQKQIAEREQCKKLGAALGVDADVSFHTEEPVLALLRGRHLGVSRPGLILGRGRRVDDRGIHKCARAQGDALVSEVCIHLCKERLGQPVPLQQVAEVEDGGLVHCLAGDAKHHREGGMRSSPSSIPAKRRIASLS